MKKLFFVAAMALMFMIFTTNTWSQNPISALDRLANYYSENTINFLRQNMPTNRENLIPVVPFGWELPNQGRIEIVPSELLKQQKKLEKDCKEKKPYWMKLEKNFTFYLPIASKALAIVIASPTTEIGKNFQIGSIAAHITIFESGKEVAEPFSPPIRKFTIWLPDLKNHF